MKPINLKTEINGELEPIINQLTEKLKTIGFGILSRIDFHSKMKEKLGKTIDPVVILGACNPQVAYEAYCANTDITSLIPCNAVVRQVGPSRFSVELTSPAALIGVLPGMGDLPKKAEALDQALQTVLNSL